MNIRLVFHGLAALLSVTFTALSIYAASRTSYFSLPIPLLAIFLTILLSLTTYPLLHLAHYLHLTSKSHLQALIARLTPHILLALNTVLITLASSRLGSPLFQACSLRQQWLRLFQAKDVRAIRRIQDALECCGFRTSRDMAWPFPDSAHGPESCEVAFGRNRGCEGPWSAEGRRIMAIMVVVGGVGVVAVVVYVGIVGEFRTAWSRQAATIHRRGISDSDERRQQLLTDGAGADATEPYTDDPEEGHADQQQFPRPENGTGRSNT